MWIPPEVSDPILLHHPTRKSVGYFGAVRLRGGKFVFQREENKFNGETFWTFLQTLRQASRAKGKKIVVVIDNARYHHAKLHKEWREKYADQFALEFLPPYSPELNSIERVWKLTRRICLHNRYFPELDNVIETVESQFDKWKRGSEVLRKLCAIN